MTNFPELFKGGNEKASCAYTDQPRAAVDPLNACFHALQRKSYIGTRCVHLRKKAPTVMTMAVPVGLSDMTVAMRVCYGVYMGRSIMRVGDEMNMYMCVAAKQCIHDHKHSTCGHKQQAKEIHDRQPLSVHNKCQERAYKRGDRIICARFCRPQVALGPDIHKNTESVRHKSKRH